MVSYECEFRDHAVAQVHVLYRPWLRLFLDVHTARKWVHESTETQRAKKWKIESVVPGFTGLGVKYFVSRG